MNRRRTIKTSAGALAGLAMMAHRAGAQEFAVVLTDAEWHSRLKGAAYRVLREGATERAGSSPLDKEYRKGTYHCAGCDLAVFSSETKFDSGTGWPSFYAPLHDAVRTRADPGWLGERTEVHCRRCGGHFGHLFDDGPAPTGRRYCMNGVALAFRAA